MTIQVKVHNRVTTVTAEYEVAVDKSEKARVGEVLVSDYTFKQKPFFVHKELNNTYAVKFPNTDPVLEKVLMAELMSYKSVKSSVPVHIHSVALPECFCKDTKFSDFYVGQEIAAVCSIEKSQYVTQTSYIEIEFSKVVSVHDGKLRTELEEIPRQIETLTDSVMICSKLDVIPFIII